MKFVCDNCQAKYQIGDDKVAGKTVRMKCRKCGYNIKVSPAGLPDAPSVDMPSHEVEAPASIGLARPVSPAVAPAPSAPYAPPAPRPAPAPAAHPVTSRPVWNEEDESTSILNAPVRDAVAAITGGAHAAPAGPAHPPRPAAPRPVTAAPHPPRPVTSAPRPYSPPGRTVPGVGGAPAAPRPIARPAGGAAVALQHEHAPHHAPETEWYVGIAGSPIGPVRVAVIRERAAAHEVDGESLVWREGMGEWRPLRTFPELLEVVTSAHAPPPPAPQAFAETPPPQAPYAPAEPPRPVVAPAPAPAPLAAAAMLAATPHAPSPFTAPHPPAAEPTPAPRVIGDPFASPFGSGAAPAAQNGKSNGFHASSPEAAAASPGLFGDLARPAAPVAAAHDAPLAPAPIVAPPKPSSVDIDPAVEEALIPRRRGNTHPMAYAFIAAAAVFGGVAAYVLLKPPPPPQVVILTTPGGPVATVTASVAAEDRGQPQVEVGDLTTSNSARPVVRPGGPLAKTSATPSTPVAPIDTSSFVSNVPGPAATGPTPPSGGGQLSAGEIQGVVQQNQAMVKRKCWMPALEGAAASAPKTARVNGALTIGASGNVESASANGAERDYPGLSSCIAGRMKNWKFPASGGSQQVNVPFVFAGQ